VVARGGRGEKGWKDERKQIHRPRSIKVDGYRISILGIFLVRVVEIRRERYEERKG
jgi:hypothetical protein